MIDGEEEDDDEGRLGDAAASARATAAPRPTPDPGFAARFCGHVNARTIKDCAWYGSRGEFVLSGSDCGHMFVYRAVDGKLLNAIRADANVVNCFAPHPHLPLLASGGIDASVKLWAPLGQAADSREEEEAEVRRLRDLLLRNRERAMMPGGGVLPAAFFRALITFSRASRGAAASLAHAGAGAAPAT